MPEKAYEVFVNALHSCYLKQSLVIPDLEDHNPAGNLLSVYMLTICTNHVLFNIPAFYITNVPSILLYTPMYLRCYYGHTGKSGHAENGDGLL